jgi:hypothetical protein
LLSWRRENEEREDYLPWVRRREEGKVLVATKNRVISW